MLGTLSVEIFAHYKKLGRVTYIVLGNTVDILWHRTLRLARELLGWAHGVSTSSQCVDKIGKTCFLSVLYRKFSCETLLLKN